MTGVADAPLKLHPSTALEWAGLILSMVGFAGIIWVLLLPLDASLLGMSSDLMFALGLLLLALGVLMATVRRTVQGVREGKDHRVIGQTLLWFGVAVAQIAPLLHGRAQGTTGLVLLALAIATFVGGLAVYAYGFYVDVIRPGTKGGWLSRIS